MTIASFISLLLFATQQADHSPIWESIRSGLAWWIFSALVQTMPPPEKLMGNIWYTWLYTFAQALGANLNLLQRNKGDSATIPKP
jgi:hypothetical protein